MPGGTEQLVTSYGDLLPHGAQLLQAPLEGRHRRLDLADAGLVFCDGGIHLTHHRMHSAGLAADDGKLREVLRQGYR